MTTTSDLQGSWGDIHTWYSDWAEGKLFRAQLPGCEKTDFCFIDQIVELDGGEFLIGLSEYDPDEDSLRVPGTLQFYHLSDIKLVWYESDMPLKRGFVEVNHEHRQH